MKIIVVLVIVLMTSVAWGAPFAADVVTIPHSESWQTTFIMDEIVWKLSADDGTIHLFKPVVMEDFGLAPVSEEVMMMNLDGSEAGTISMWTHYEDRSLGFRLEWRHIGIEE